MDEIPYVDFPELRINKYESTEMPFRYVKCKAGEPVMPKVVVDRCLVRASQTLTDIITGDVGTN